MNFCINDQFLIYQLSIKLFYNFKIFEFNSNLKNKTDLKEEKVNMTYFIINFSD